MATERLMVIACEASPAGARGSGSVRLGRHRSSGHPVAEVTCLTGGHQRVDQDARGGTGGAVPQKFGVHFKPAARTLPLLSGHGLHQVSFDDR